MLYRLPSENKFFNTRDSIRLIQEGLAGKGLHKNVQEWTRPSKTTKAHRHSKAPFGIFDADYARFHDGYIDVVGALTHYEGAVFSLPVWIDSLYDVKTFRWPIGTLQTSSLSSC